MAASFTDNGTSPKYYAPSPTVVDADPSVVVTIDSSLDKEDITELLAVDAAHFSASLYIS